MSKTKEEIIGFGILAIEFWDLFGIWKLKFGF
jgi:hypothetical protein